MLLFIGVELNSTGGRSCSCQPQRYRSCDHRQIEVDYDLCQPLFNHSEAGFLIRNKEPERDTVSLINYVGDPVTTYSDYYLRYKGVEILYRFILKEQGSLSDAP